MRLKPKRRIILVVSSLLVLAAGAFSLVVVRNWQKQRISEDFLTKGLSAFKERNYYQALYNSGQYLSRVRTDAAGRGNPRHADALLAYAESRRLIEEPDFRNLPGCVDWYKRYLDFNPGDTKAGLTLLQVYNQMGHSLEATTLAPKFRTGDLTKATPADVPVLREEAVARVENRFFTGEELVKTDAVISRLLELEPLDPQGFIARYRTNAETNRRADSEALVKRLLTDFPDDSRSKLIAGLYQRFEGKQGSFESAREYFCQAAGLDPKEKTRLRPGTISDEAATLWLLDGFKGLGEFDSEFLVLRDSADRMSSLMIERQLLRRLWQEGDFDEVIKRTNKLDPASLDSDAESLGLRAFSLVRTDKLDEATAIAAALKKREGNYRAAAWAAATPLYADMIRKDWKGSAEAVSAWKGIAKDCPTEPILFYCYGEALAAIGSNDDARQAWRDSVKYSIALSWYLPRVRISETFLKDNRAADAVEAADDAFRFGPNRVLANVVRYEAYAARLQTGAATGPNAAILAIKCDEAMRLILKESKEERERRLWERLVVPHVIFLSKADQRKAAIEAAEAAIKADPPLAIETLQRLAQVSGTEKLGIEKACLDRIEALSGETIDVKFVRAMELAMDGKREKGIELIRSAAEADPTNWNTQAALPRYLERSTDSDKWAEAAAEWAKLGDRFPEVLEVQYACLESEAAASDAAFMERTLKRYAALKGGTPGSTDAIATIAKSRAMLHGNPKKADCDEAITLLKALVEGQPKNVQAKRLLAAAVSYSDSSQEIEPDLPRAASLLTEATVLEPANSRVAIELVQVLKLQGQFDKAREQLVRIAGDQDREDYARRRAAELLVEQGDRSDVATRTLEELILKSGTKVDPAILVTLAEGYVNQGNDKEASRVYDRLATDAATDVNSIYMTARYFDMRKLPERAKPALDRLQTLELKPGVKDYITARLAADRGDIAKMKASFDAALSAAPKSESEEYWRQYITALIKNQQFAEALAVLDRAEKALPQDKGFSVLRAQAQLMKATEEQGAASTNALSATDRLKQTLAADPRNAQLNEIVVAIDQAAKQGELATADGYVRLADRYPNSPPLQIFVARAIAPVDPTRTTVLLTRAMAADPTDPGAARSAAEIYYATRRFPEMLSASLEWRQRDRTRSVEADIAVAEAYLRTQQPEKGLQVLTPRVAEAQKDPAGEFSKGVLGIQARLLLATNREPEARALLAPMLKLTTDWRIFVWLRVAVESAPTLELGRAWLAQLREAIPPDAVDEIGICAGSRIVLADRFPANSEEIRRETLADLTKLSESPKTASGYVFECIGMIYHGMGELPKAEAAYRRALDIDPDHPRPTCYNNLANILFEGVRQEEALKLATLAVEIDKKTGGYNADYTDTLAEAYARLSMTAESKGDAAGAKKYAKDAADNYMKVTSLRIGGPDPIVAAATNFERADDFDSAIKCYEILARAPLKPEKMAEVKNNYAMAIVRAHRTAELGRAAELVDQAIKLMPHPAFYDTLGWVELERGRPQSAAEAFTKSLSLYAALNKKDESSPRIGRAIALLQSSGARAEGESVVKDLASAKLPPYEAQRLEELKKLLASGKP